ncbi:MAG: DEAD/DEAH box helicase family protein [Methylovulum sp.]|nr:DEAD/DEAH box helicase family protein [Methylovulum sp.]
MDNLEQQIAALEQKIQTIDAEREALFQELTLLKREHHQSQQSLAQLIAEATVTQLSCNRDKISLFRSLFKGRDDVYPKRWVNSKTGISGYSFACSNEWKPNICRKNDKPPIKCGDCQFRSFIPISDSAIANHLAGTDNPRNSSADFVMGVYPLMQDERCWFLAVDFDKASWQLDVGAFATACKESGVPYNIEISRSGKGAHIWLFFSFPVLAMEARKLGSYLLTLAMDEHPELGFESYDRLFPNQDTMPKGGFGNLIALPLQKKPRQQGNSVFVDDNFFPYPDQWAYLSTIKRISPLELNLLVEKAEQQNRILGVKLPIAEEDGEPWKISPSRKIKEIIMTEPLPKQVNIVLGNQLFIDNNDLPAILQSKILRLAAFQNPEFYKAQAMRLSTFGKPRIISCAEYYSQHIALPRGCQNELMNLLDELKIQPVIQDERFFGNNIPEIQFQGQLTGEQTQAANKLLEHDIGTLSATTAFGKTVIALHILAKRQVNTLIIVHRRQLLDQWMERIETFLNVPKKQIGKIGGGKSKPSGIIDVAIMQSLTKNNTVDDLVAKYGQVIFDECHHLSAVSFESVAKACKAKYVLGLSATLTRKDGHHPIVFMQCGPVRYQVSAKQQALARPFDHYVTQRQTAFMMPDSGNTDSRTYIHELYQALVLDEQRNRFILDDIKQALAEGRSPIVLTGRKEHVLLLTEQIKTFANNVIIMQGGMGVKQRKQLADALQSIPDDEERVIIATGSYLGEGFDDARLDTLFLVMPVSWKGTLAQYVGRLHRLHHAKTEVRIYDYVDSHVPMLNKMSERRKMGYKSLGYNMINFS